MTSELNRFYRLPKININLPSGGKFYDKDFIKFSMDGSLPVRAMTAKDELLLKSPDALLNGDCLVHIISSCVPEISDVKKLSAPDVEAVLLAIFHASFKPTIEFKSTCPACGHENEFEIEIRQLLDLNANKEIDNVVSIDLGVIENVPTKFLVHVKPYTFETNTRHQLMTFEHSKLLQIMGNDNTSDEDKIKAFNTSFKKMVDLKFKNVLDCVLKIVIVRHINGEEQTQEITDVSEITDFIFNADKAFVEPVIERIEKLNASGVNNHFDAVCTGTVDRLDGENKVKVTCGHKWPTTVEFNPTSFFVKNSSR